MRDHDHAGLPAELLLEVQPMACADGGRRSDAPEELVPVRGLTMRYYQHAVDVVLRTDLADASRRLALPRPRLRRIARDVGRRLEAIEPGAAGPCIAVDDLHLGGSTYTVIADPLARRLVDLLDGRPSRVIRDWLSRRADGLAVVAIDGDAALRRAILDARPGVAIVLDRFHAQRAVTECVLGVRRLASDLLPRRYEAEGRRVLDRLHHRLATRWHALDAEGRAALDAAIAAVPALGAAYRARDRFAAIFDAPHHDVEGMLDAWVADVRSAGLAEVFRPVLRGVVRDWRAEIVAAARHKITSGYVEAMNRQIRDRWRRGRGSASFAQLRTWALVRHGGYAPAQVRAAALAAAGGER